jgi:hypothetical protein
LASRFIPSSVESHRDRYVQAKGLTIIESLGEGKDGYVWETSRKTALKIHITEESYQIERDAYIRLRMLGITEVAGFRVPRLRDHEDSCLAIEMDIVVPPFYVDFASAIFDSPPDFIEDEGNSFEDFIRHRFDERADDALTFYYELAARTGIYLPDIHRENMKFG